MDSPARFAIREVVPPDFPQWLPLWEAYNAFYGRSGSSSLPKEVTATTWRRFVDPREPTYALVAEYDGWILGLAHYVFHRSTIAVNDTCYLQDLFTEMASRGRGIGGALIEAVCVRAKRAGCSRVYWQTHETNAAARTLYDRVAERSGFLVYRRAL
jgi:GNAT superfamily N-acetyltransferase